MTIFCRVLEQLDEHMAPEPDARMVAAIRAGLNIDPNFWNDFLRLCNSPALPYLLGVNKSTISQWPAKIREYLTHVETMDSQDASRNKKANLITTGY